MIRWHIRSQSLEIAFRKDRQHNHIRTWSRLQAQQLVRSFTRHYWAAVGRVSGDVRVKTLWDNRSKLVLADESRLLLPDAHKQSVLVTGPHFHVKEDPASQASNVAYGHTSHHIY